MILEKDDGMILVIVLLVLVSAIIIGITVMSSSTIETKIIGNERIYKQGFYTAESGVDYAIENSVAAMTTIGVSLNGTYTYPSSTLPSMLGNTTISIMLTNITNPPVGSGFSVNNFSAHYYRIDSTDTGQTIEVGVWKAFPKN